MENKEKLKVFLNLNLSLMIDKPLCGMWNVVSRNIGIQKSICAPKLNILVGSR